MARTAFSLEELAGEVEAIAGDDEITTKIVLKFLERLQGYVDRGENPPAAFYSDIVRDNWPYASEAPNMDYTVREEVCVEEKEQGSQVEAYLAEIQRKMGRKVKGRDLVTMCRNAGEKIGVRLKKKELVSKTRLVQWMIDNNVKLEDVTL